MTGPGSPEALFGIPVIESPYVPDGEMWVLSVPSRLIIIKTAVPVVPYGEIWCERGRHSSLVGACPFCGAER